MQKIKMSRGVTLTFEEGCKRYLENCRQRNLREGTINHYKFFYKLNHTHSNMMYLDKFEEFLGSFDNNPFKVNEDKCLYIQECVI